MIDKRRRQRRLGLGRLTSLSELGSNFLPASGETIMNITVRHFLQSASATLLALSCGISIAAAQPVIIERGVMPAPRVEVIPAPPGAGYNWVPGHWAWQGGWVWIPGHHIRGVVPAMPAELVEVVPARPGAEYYWVKGHHVWEGNRWVWHRGVWAR
jgi:WXXGXW repeat (2 copies)